MLMIFESSNVSAFRDFGDKYHYVKDQFKGFVIGLSGMIIISLIPYKKFYDWSLPLLFITLIFLFAVFVPGLGIKAYGASRWLDFHFLNFQPTEFAKLVLILYFSAWLKDREKGRFLPFLLLLGLIVGLVILQPDMGTALIITIIAILMYFISGAPIRHFTALIPFLLIGTFVLAVSSPYRLKRLTTFLNPNQDPLGASYHIRQILISLGSGGLFGVGLGNSLQKYQYLPEANTDSIFAIMAEEFGFIGSTVFIIIFLIFLLRILRVAQHAPDKYSMLLAAGVLTFFAAQFAMNLGAMVTLLPLTGIPLPFISYGGSSLAISLTAVGIVLNVSKHATVE